jgi:hypothetical protein
MHTVYTASVENTDFSVSVYNLGQSIFKKEASAVVKSMAKTAGVLSLALVTSSAMTDTPIRTFPKVVESKTDTESNNVYGTSLIKSSNF